MCPVASLGLPQLCPYQLAADARTALPAEEPGLSGRCGTAAFPRASCRQRGSCAAGRMGGAGLAVQPSREDPGGRITNNARRLLGCALPCPQLGVRWVLGSRQGEDWGRVLASHPAAGRVGGQEDGQEDGQDGAGQGSCVQLGSSFSRAAGGDGAPSRNSPRWWQELAQASAALKVHRSLAGLACLLRVPEASSDHCPAAPPASTWHSLQDVPVSARLQPAPLQRVCLGAEPAGSSSSSYHSRSTQAGGRPPPACCGPAAPPLGYNML